MNKKLIERLALEVAMQLPEFNEANMRDDIIEFATRFLSAYLAERGGEAAAWQYELAESLNRQGEYCNWVFRISDEKPNVPEGSIRNLKSLFLAPQIPEGMALVPKKFSKDIAVRYLGRELLNMDRVWFSVATRDYEQMIAAAGVAP